MADVEELADEIGQLRRRAAALRDVASALDRSTVHELRAISGPDTWIGPTATWFDEVALGASRAADVARDDLRAAARRMEERAEALRAEQAARQVLA